MQDKSVGMERMLRVGLESLENSEIRRFYDYGKRKRVDEKQHAIAVDVFTRNDDFVSRFD
jgi:low affinity Fe/Cu permease